MMHRVPFAFFLVVVEQGEVDHPVKVELVFFAFVKIAHVSDLKSKATEDFADRFPLVTAEQDQVSFFDTEPLGQCRLFFIAEKFHDR